MFLISNNSNKYPLAFEIHEWNEYCFVGFYENTNYLSMYF